MGSTPLGTTNSTKPRSIGRGFVLPEKKFLKIVVFLEQNFIRPV